MRLRNRPGDTVSEHLARFHHLTHLKWTIELFNLKHTETETVQLYYLLTCLHLGFLCLSGETNDVCRKVLQISTDIALTKKDEPYMQPGNKLGILPLSVPLPRDRAAKSEKS